MSLSLLYYTDRILTGTSPKWNNFLFLFIKNINDISLIPSTILSSTTLKFESQSTEKVPYCIHQFYRSWNFSLDSNLGLRWSIYWNPFDEVKAIQSQRIPLSHPTTKIYRWSCVTRKLFNTGNDNNNKDNNQFKLWTHYVHQTFINIKQNCVTSFCSLLNHFLQSFLKAPVIFVDV